MNYAGTFPTSCFVKNIHLWHSLHVMFTSTGQLRDFLERSLSWEVVKVKYESSLAQQGLHHNHPELKPLVKLVGSLHHIHTMYIIIIPCTNFISS